MQTVKIELTVDETNFVLGQLGNLPTSAGVWPVLMKIKQQAEDSLKQQAIAEQQ